MPKREFQINLRFRSFTFRVAEFRVKGSLVATFRLTPGQVAIGFPNALVKLLRLLFHPISSARFLHSRLRGSRIDIENKSDVWDAIADRKYVQTFDRLTI